MKTSLLVLAVAFAPAAWIGCSSSDPAVSGNDTSDSGTPSGDGGNTADDGSTSGGDGSTGTDGSTGKDGGGGPADAGTKDSGTVVGPIGASVCDGGAFGAGGLLALSTNGDDRLDSVTPDELSIAWTVGTGGTAVLYYADRALASDAWGTPQSFAAGTYTADRVALSPNGLRLVVVKADRSGFEELTRTNRTGTGSTFTLPTDPEGPFTNNVNFLVPSGSSVGDPVIDSSDTDFFYSQYDGTGGKTIFKANRLGLSYDESWGIGFAIDGDSSLEAVGSARRQPTGVSADARTLFLYDQTTSTERVTTLSTSSGAWGATVDYGQHLYAAPTESCGSLYYSAAGASTLDLFTATR
ncbi:MAG TPA: hypothetical protein VF407_21135 [Polyangiaceae bacterium]